MLSTGRRGKIIPPSQRANKISPTITEDQAIQGFSAVLLPFSDGEIATAAQATKQAAKGWRQGKAMPRAVPLLNMAQNLPGVWEWICATQGHEHESPKALDELLRAALKHVERSK